MLGEGCPPIASLHMEQAGVRPQNIAVVVLKLLWANLRAMLICKCVLSLDNLPDRSLRGGTA